MNLILQIALDYSIFCPIWYFKMIKDPTVLYECVFLGDSKSKDYGKAYIGIFTSAASQILFPLPVLTLKKNSSSQISDDGRYAVLSITEGCEPVNQLWYCDLKQLPDGIKGLC